MLKQTVRYEDFEGNMVSEDLFFNLTRMELINFQDKYGKDMAEYLNEIQKKEDAKEIYHVLQDVVITSYGVKSENGKRFIKNDQVRNEFLDSLAYAQLIEDFHDEKQQNLTNFIKGIVAHIKGINLDETEDHPASK